MTEFAKQNPIKYRFWAEVDDLSLLQAALLTFDIEPFSLDECREHTGKPVTLGRVTGRTISRKLAGFLVQNFALDHEDLPDMREIEESVQGRAAPDAPRFNAAVIGR